MLAWPNVMLAVVFSLSHWASRFTAFGPIEFAVLGLMSLVPLAFLCVYVRISLFVPCDQPTIFDRKNRKVYRLFREEPRSMAGLFRPWPMRACEYEWDLMDAEHFTELVPGRGGSYHQHFLNFIVRRGVGDPTIIDSFSIGSPRILKNDADVNAAWEHIRRFMEDSGPPLPGGQVITKAPIPRGFREWLNRYFRCWRDELPLTLLAHALFPLSLMGLFCLWLVHATTRSVEWPAEVVSKVGPKMAARRERSDL
jgi:hypothetical protein